MYIYTIAICSMVGFTYWEPNPTQVQPSFPNSKSNFMKWRVSHDTTPHDNGVSLPPAELYSFPWPISLPWFNDSGILTFQMSWYLKSQPIWRTWNSSFLKFMHAAPFSRMSVIINFLHAGTKVKQNRLSFSRVLLRFIYSWRPWE